MTTLAPTPTPTPTPTSAPAATQHLATRGLAAALAVGVAYAHVKDQGGFPGDKAPGYVGGGYYLLELAAVVVAVALLVRANRPTWLLSLGVAVGPVVGFVLSRGPGLPDYNDDKGNWFEPLAVGSLLVEAVLLLLSGFVLLRARR